MEDVIENRGVDSFIIHQKMVLKINEKLDVFMMIISGLFAVAVIIYLFYSILSQTSTINVFGTFVSFVMLSRFLVFIVSEAIKCN